MRRRVPLAASEAITVELAVVAVYLNDSSDSLSSVEPTLRLASHAHARADRLPRSA